ncbi:PQQ-dependent sugar dehydrogenase [Pannonibacter phragmitetus]|uniref:PQQ-dependent sugar dehydrogenase n=1 Tax=Pannonibacter phragmitetus TaxID=121719 RepID=UPI003D2EDAC4
MFTRLVQAAEILDAPVTPLPLGLAAVMAGAAPAAIAQENLLYKAIDFQMVEVAGELEHPWSLAFLPDGRMLVTERPGRLRIVGADGSLSAPLKGLPEIYDSGQGGLLDVILDPDFAENSTIYFSYSTPVERRGTTRIARAKLADTSLEDVTVLFTAKTKGSNGRHFGSRLVFGKDGYLYASIGDHGADETAQDLSLHSGKIIRITKDGAPAPDNPFLNTAGALPEIYTYGNRNPQGMALAPSGEIWANEHGPRGGDEVNVIKAGLNFGWPDTTYGRAYSGLPMGEGPEKEGVTPPIRVYIPSIAPSGMAFYQGNAFKEWQGDLFMGALALTHLNRLDIKDGKIVGEERLLEDLGWRIRDVREGPDGFLYLLTDAEDGKLVRIEPAK